MEGENTKQHILQGFVGKIAMRSDLITAYDNDWNAKYSQYTVYGIDFRNGMAWLGRENTCQRC